MEINIEGSSLEINSMEPKKKKIGKKIIIFILSIILVLAVAAGLFAVSVIKDVKGGGAKDKVTIVIDEGDSVDNVAQKLYDSRLIKYKFAFKLYAQIKNQNTEFTVGKHKVEGDSGYAAILLTLRQKKPVTYPITIPEGLSQREIAEKLKGILPWQDEDTATAINQYDISGYDFLRGLPERENRLEGYIYPDTYIGFLQSDSTDTFLKLALDEFKGIIEKNDIEEKAKALGMTLDEAVTLASVIQEEVSDPADMKRVSAVFHGRLERDMKLQSCVTVLYALGSHKSAVTYEDTRVESPYNTYYITGLPKGPICSPGEEALVAAVTPDLQYMKEGYLYFYTPPDGSVIFSKTFSQHTLAVNAHRGGKGTDAAE